MIASSEEQNNVYGFLKCTVMDHAKEVFRKEKQLKKRARYYNEFVSACRLNNLMFIKKCVDDGIDINVMNDDFKTGLMMAVLHEKVEVVEYLIGQRAIDVSITGGHYDRWSALHYAARYNKKSLKILKLILNRKPPGYMHETGRKEVMNKKDKDGFTPLDHAYSRKYGQDCILQKCDIVNLLKQYNCKSNCFDEDGEWVGLGNGDLNTLKNNC
eukprot:g3716.t1